MERGWKAGIEQEDGSIVERTKGTPQGGVISPLLANLYLHYAFDKWMEQSNINNPFERYADDSAPGMLTVQATESNALLEMAEGPPEPACRSWFQITVSCMGKEPL